MSTSMLVHAVRRPQSFRTGERALSRPIRSSFRWGRNPDVYRRRARCPVGALVLFEGRQGVECLGPFRDGVAADRPRPAAAGSRRGPRRIADDGTPAEVR